MRIYICLNEQWRHIPVGLDCEALCYVRGFRVQKVVFFCKAMESPKGKKRLETEQGTGRSIFQIIPDKNRVFIREEHDRLPERHSAYPMGKSGRRIIFKRAQATARLGEKKTGVLMAGEKMFFLSYGKGIFEF